MTDDGWIEWGGGPCPVAPETKVQVRYRNGRTSYPCSAWSFAWERGPLSVSDYAIVAYRVEPKQEELRP